MHPWNYSAFNVGSDRIFASESHEQNLHLRNCSLTPIFSFVSLPSIVHCSVVSLSSCFTSQLPCTLSSSSAFPAKSLGFTIFGEVFAHETIFFNPTKGVVTFCLHGLCILGVFLLLAFTRLGQECQDRLSLCDEMHKCKDWTSIYTLIQKSCKEWS